MSELDELTEGKSLAELQKELDYQINKMGESIGGIICSHIIYQIELTNKIIH